MSPARHRSQTQNRPQPRASTMGTASSSAPSGGASQWPVEGGAESGVESTPREDRHAPMRAALRLSPAEGSRACASSGACAGPARRAERNRHTSPGNNSLKRGRPGRTEPRAPRSLSRAHHAQPKTAAVFGPSPRAHRGRRKPDTNRGATSRDTGQFVRDRGVRLARRSQQHDLGALRQSGTDSKTPSSGIVPQDHHQRRVA